MKKIILLFSLIFVFNPLFTRAYSREQAKRDQDRLLDNYGKSLSQINEQNALDLQNSYRRYKSKTRRMRQAFSNKQISHSQVSQDLRRAGQQYKAETRRIKRQYQRKSKDANKRLKKNLKNIDRRVSK